MIDAWPEARELFDLDPKVSHLNHGSFGAVPKSVREHQDALRRMMVANPNKFFRRQMPDLLERAREAAAELVGARTDDLALTANVTEGVAAVLGSLRLEPGDELIVTDHVYGGVWGAVREVARRSGAIVVTIVIEPNAAHDGESVARAVSGSITSRTRIAILEQITSPTSLHLDLASAIRVFRDAHVPVLIDGAHAPGMVDVMAHEYGTTWWVGNFHKWACAPPGAACLWSSPAGRENLAPPWLSWYTEDGFPASFRWTGTDDQLPRLCIPAVRSFMDDLGWDKVRSYSHELLLQAQDVMETFGLQLIGALPNGQMASFALPEGMVKTREAADLLMARLAEHGCELAVSCWRGEGLLRISTHCYNGQDDLDRLGHALQHVLSR